jgi:hypothetical protein
MENQADRSRGDHKGSGFKVFATKRIILSAILIVATVWLFGWGLDMWTGTTKQTDKAGLAQMSEVPQPDKDHAPPMAEASSALSLSVSPSAENKHSNAQSAHSEPTTEAVLSPGTGADHPAVTTAQAPAHESSRGTAAAPQDQGATPKPTQENAVQHQPAEKPSHAAEPPPEAEVRPRGVAFVEAVIQPIDYELNKRFWGWRPNDILNLTDNINNYQLGVLEATRRSVVMLAERISRTGSTDSLNPHLEDAANWLMVTATRYWFPSPESKYKECIDELKAYKQELIQGRASFYIRTDNLIPLLASYEDLLGSCDENLVKRKNEDGSVVSFFKADDYFFYAKGVASAMASILEAVLRDFSTTLENRHGTELLHHALEACRRAAALNPLIITNADLDGILANHRANMAAPISHARFYIGQLIKTLST